MNEEFELLDASDPKKNAVSKVQVEVPLKQLMLFESPQIIQMKEEIIITEETGFKNDIDTLWLMSNFKNLIISNSTFYWWGAYFSDFKFNQTKIITSSKFPNSDTNQKNWIVI